MLVVPLVDGRVETYRNDDGALLNTGSTAVVLAMPSPEKLRVYWHAFLEELRSNFFDLWSTPHDEVVNQFGLLGYNGKNLALRRGNLWGLAPKNFAESKSLARVRQRAALSAIVAAGLLTEERCGKTKFKGTEGLAVFVNDLPIEDQRKFVDALLHPGCDLDEVILFPQGNALGLRKVGTQLESQPSAETFLRQLAQAADDNARIPVGAKRATQATRWYAPMWFSAYLAREGVWLLPLDHVQFANSAFPVWMRPIQFRLSLPRNMRGFCDQLMRDHLARQPLAQASALVVHTAIKLGLASNVWSYGKLCAGPLIGYKKHSLSESKSPTHRSWAVNRLWEAQLHHYSASADQHPDAHAFVLGKRLVSKGTRPFEWVHSPNKRNTKNYQRLYGCVPTEFPDWLVSWADALERILPLFRVEAIDLKIKPLNLWLLYLAGLSAPPRSFEEISRPRHINSAGAPTGNCFRQFLSVHYPDQHRGTASVAMATLRQAWALASVQDGFATRLSNPCDLSDSPFEYRGRGARTVRSALDARVAEIIARENMHDDMAFARQLGTKGQLSCWRLVRCPESGELEQVFFPAAPLLIHVILHTGMRGMQARWLDTGEGDGEIIDFERLGYRPNPSPAARKQRREGFLRICDTMGDAHSKVIGMWVNTGKSGPHEVPWIHEDLIAPVRALQEFQARYYPLAQPVTVERNLNFDSALKKKKGDAFPLARDPINRLGHPISEARLRSYWKLLLEHCQAIVDAELGYHYVLIGPDGNPKFDIHSLRVTIITTLLEHGVPVTVVQMLVGHKSPIMTWYYQDVTNYKIHSALQSLLERRKESLKNPDNLSEVEEVALTSDIITFRTDEDFEGAEMLKAHRETGSALDVFSHGICPGGSCEIGGDRMAEGRYKPVWRPRACSGCRFRVTGPAFLNGLVQRANALIWEIKASMRKEADLSLHVEEEEDAGRPVGHLRSTIRQEQELRDSLFSEWCLEVRTINRAEAIMRQEAGQSAHGAKNALMTDHDVSQMSTRFREAHEFELAQRLVHDADIIQAGIDLPTDALLYRDLVLHRIAHSNRISDYFYSLDSRVAHKALNLFGETLITHTQSADQLQEIIDGSLLLREVPGLDEALTTALVRSESAARLAGEVAA